MHLKTRSTQNNVEENQFRRKRRREVAVRADYKSELYRSKVKWVENEFQSPGGTTL